METDFFYFYKYIYIYINIKQIQNNFKNYNSILMILYRLICLDFP